MVRISSQNDWVIFILIGCIFLYVIMLLSLKRDSTVLEFLRQQFEDSSNIFLSWSIIGLVFCLLLATFISPFVPVIPVEIRKLNLFGLQLNRFGFTFMVVSLLYLLRNLFSYLFFAGTGALQKWSVFYFTASKFYFCASSVLMVLCFIDYFYPVDFHQILPYYFFGFAISFFLKLIYYLSHPGNILPPKWYYKFLYICTLQIAPVLVLWKLLFF